MTRSISYSETATLLDCQAKHAFAYTGALTDGDALTPNVKHARLREGKAWGMAMAAFHQIDAEDALTKAHAAIGQSLTDDIKEMPFGLDAEGQVELADMGIKLHDLLTHYSETCQPIGIDRQELKLEVQIPSRGGRRRSNLYRFTGFVDGIKTDDHGDWIVDFKLRGLLSSVEQVAINRQFRWYAWAWRELTGRSVAGLIIDERWNRTPKPARWVQGKKKGEGLVPSHAKDQLTTTLLYFTACQEAGVTPDDETLLALDARQWQTRHEVFLTDREIDEAGQQLTSLANLVGQFDSGSLYPVRNPSDFRCPSCAFKTICPDPTDSELVDALFVRKPAKKDRTEVVAA